MKKFVFVMFIFLSANIFAQSEAMVINPDGNVGIGTDNPLAKLTVNGNLIRRIKIATGLGPVDMSNNGRIMSRTLVFTKVYDDTAIRILYSDILRVIKATSASSACWEIKINEESVPGCSVDGWGVRSPEASSEGSAPSDK
jgi:hypothetical protein